ncbi:MAG: FAD-binding oxidoreductase [Nitratireductor sp.]|nr:FAD-binding oxidoreductase [Nitratireductor sp.]
MKDTSRRNGDAPGASKRVLVIGAGIVGVAAAIWLKRDGHDVTLVDRGGPAAGTSYGNAGLLASSAIIPVATPGLLAKAPKMLLDPNEPLFVKWRYLPKLLPWLPAFLKNANAADAKRIAAALYHIVGDSLADHQALAAGTGAEHHIVPSDYMVVYKDRAAFEKDAFGWGIRKAHGFEWQELEGDALRRRVPGLAPGQDFAVVLGNHGYITDPGRYVAALARHFAGQGGREIRAEVSEIAIEAGRLRGAVIDRVLEPYDAVLVATGAWSRRLMQSFGLRMPLESERGYHMEFWNPSRRFDTPMMISSGKFVATSMEGRIRCAGIVELGGLAAPPSKAPFALLERQFRRAFPDLTWERTETWMGHRPTLTDSLPVIGEIDGAAGVFAGFGHQHVGLTGGPKTGWLLAQLIGGKKPNTDLAAYSPMRFQ